MKTALRDSKRFPRVALLAPLLAMLALEAVHGCNVPVFYFALFEWRANPHRLALGESPKGADVASIKDRVNRSVANVEMDSPSSTIPAGHVQIRFPKTNRLWWDAPLPGNDPQKGLDLLLDSPARQQVVHQLESGVSVVWVFLDSGDKKIDDAAFGQFTGRLKYLQKVVELPAADNGNQIEEGPDPNKSPVPLKIAFSAVRVSRNDPREVGFVAQLLNVIPDLHAIKTPMAYPVFGRALMMAPLYGENLTNAHIDRWTEYAAGACSCQVKDQNPGFDLLVTADWDHFLGTVQQQ